MAKKILGIDIGTDMIKIVQLEGNRVLSSSVRSLPDHLVNDGNIVSVEAMSEIIREMTKEMGIKKANAATSINGSNTFVRMLTVPQMNEEQLLYNIPYEFKDYISEELKTYAFDYAMISSAEEIERRRHLLDDELANTMDILAAACPRETIEKIQYMCKKSNLKLVKLMPTISSYMNIIRMYNGSPSQEYCIVNIGYDDVEVEIFKGDVYKASRKLGLGLKDVDRMIAENKNVDIHIAHTYFTKNFEQCQDAEYVLDIYRSMAVDLSRALNFYQFNYRDSQLNDVYICGGGAKIQPLINIFRDTLSQNIHFASELLVNEVEDGDMYFQTIGLALEG